MRTYTPSSARQNLFKIIQYTNQSNRPIQITSHRKNKATNDNVYVISQKQYQQLHKQIETEQVQRGLHNLIYYAKKYEKPLTKKEFEHEIGL